MLGTLMTLAKQECFVSKQEGVVIAIQMNADIMWLERGGEE
jgi:hypothetical protein